MSHEQSHVPGGTGSTYTWWIDRLGAVQSRVEVLWNVLLFSSLYLAIIAAIEVSMVITLLSLQMSLAPVIVGLVTYAVYANDRIADADDDELSKPDQTAFVNRHRDLLYVTAAGSYGIAVALSILGGPLALGLTLLPGAFWVLYATDWIPDVGVHVKRLKEVLVLNTAMVALAWAVSLTFIPLAFADRRLTPAVVLVFLYFFLRSFVDTELPNVRDVRSDEAAGVKTLPVVFGTNSTRIALFTVDLLTVGIVYYAVATGWLSVLLGLALFTGIVYSVGITFMVGRRSGDEWITVAPEFEYVIVGIVLAVIVLGG